MASLAVRVVSPAEVVYEGEASSIVAPTWDGQVGVLPGHAPMMALLGHGMLSVDQPGGGSEEWYVAGGVLKVEKNQATILVESASSERPSDAGPAVTPEDLIEATAQQGAI